MWIWIAVAVVVVLLVLFVVWLYNRLVQDRNRVDQAWSQVDVQLRLRYDLVPNLVETVKGYAAHERQTLEAVIGARNQAVSAAGPEQQGQAEGLLTGALGRLFALAEAYPDLKANQNFLNLQEELSAVEGKIAYARQFYNDAVYSYNTRIQSVPSNFLAKPFGFTEREYFEVQGEGREPVRVQF
jgi:LemA protein